MTGVRLTCHLASTLTSQVARLHSCLVDGATIYKYMFISLMRSRQNTSDL